MTAAHARTPTTHSPTTTLMSLDVLGPRRQRVLALFYLSAFTSTALFVAAFREHGEASLGLNLVTPIFALGHHLLAVVQIHSGRGTSGAAGAGPPLAREHRLVLRVLAGAYTCATLVVLAVFVAYWRELRAVDCTLVGGSLRCDDPRGMLWVLAQNVLGVAECALAWLLVREANPAVAGPIALSWTDVLKPSTPLSSPAIEVGFLLARSETSRAYAVFSPVRPSPPVRAQMLNTSLA
jgi:hypothetical protein